MEEIVFLAAKISGDAKTPKSIWIHPKPYYTTKLKIDDINLLGSQSKIIKYHIQTLENTQILWKEDHLNRLFQRENNTGPLRCHPFHRAKIVEWLVNLCFNSGINNESLFLSVRILDRVLENLTEDINLKLLALECIWIASKYEMDFVFDINDIHLLSNYKFSKKKIKETEIKILQILDHNIGEISSLDFLVHFNEFDTTTFFCFIYFCEIMLLYSEMQTYYPSLIAASAIYLGRTIKTGIVDIEWSETDIINMKHHKEEIIFCLKKAFEVIDTYKGLAITTIKIKYDLIK